MQNERKKFNELKNKLLSFLSIHITKAALLLINGIFCKPPFIECGT